MTFHLEHVALWTTQLETLKEFYQTHFGAVAGEKYHNPQKSFESYFLEFTGGARLEIMSRPDILPNRFQGSPAQTMGLTHLAFGVSTPEEVDQKARLMKQAGLPILSGPRKTGDGYYEFETLDPDGNRLEVTTKYRG